MLLAVLLVLCVLRSCLGPEPGTQPAAGAALPPAQPFAPDALPTWLAAGGLPAALPLGQLPFVYVLELGSGWAQVTGPAPAEF